MNILILVSTTHIGTSEMDATFRYVELPMCINGNC